jgi:hypothetical protein
VGEYLQKQLLEHDSQYCVFINLRLHVHGNLPTAHKSALLSALALGKSWLSAALYALSPAKIKYLLVFRLSAVVSMDVLAYQSCSGTTILYYSIDTRPGHALRLIERNINSLIDFVFNLLKPTGYMMHQQFNIQQLYDLTTLYVCVVFI